HGIGTGRLHATPGPILKMNLPANRMLQGTNPPVLIAANMLGIGAENPTHQIHMLAAKYCTPGPLARRQTKHSGPQGGQYRQSTRCSVILSGQYQINHYAAAIVEVEKFH